MLLRYIIVISCIFFSTNLFAKYTCKGQVQGVSFEPKTGALYVEKIGPLQWQRLCKVNADYNGVSPETCKAIYSILLTAQTTKKEVVLWFNDDQDCSTSSHIPWSTLTGWYFGPKIEG